ncbi:MAG: hypothetical protein OXT65_09320 [Alphaproteobacteria bacterium]|nr:hypothetical protein [Alphaproteobacteria bacterium]
MKWRQMEDHEVEALLPTLSRLGGLRDVDAAACRFEDIGLPFYHFGNLIRVTVPDNHDFVWYVRLEDESITRLDGHEHSVHACNDRAPLTLTDELINPYVRFMCYFSGLGKVFELRVKRSAVGYTGKVWIFEDDGFFEHDVNVTVRGVLVTLERTPVADVPQFFDASFSL